MLNNFLIRSNYNKNIYPETPEEINIEDAIDSDVILRFRKIGNGTGADGKYTTGDLITFMITVKNPYYYEVCDIELIDNDSTYIDENSGNSTIAQPLFLSVPPEGIRTTTATYTVNEFDIINGSDMFFNIEAQVNGEYSFYSDIQLLAYDIFVEPNYSINIIIEELSTPINQNGYDYGETVEYKISVINNGNVSLSDIELTDNEEGTTYTFSNNLYPNEIWNIHYSNHNATIQIFEYYILNGELPIEIIVTAYSIIGEQYQFTETLTIPVAPINSVMSVSYDISEPSNGTDYEEGDVVTITPTIENIGNVCIYNLEINDNLDYYYSYYVYDLYMNDTRVLQPLEYEITADDISNGYFEISIDATWNDGNGESYNNTYSVEFSISTE